MVDGNLDLALGLGELAQLTVNNESESNVDVSLVDQHFIQFCFYLPTIFILDCRHENCITKNLECQVHFTKSF